MKPIDSGPDSLDSLELPIRDEDIERWVRVVVRTALTEMQSAPIKRVLDCDSPDRDILTFRGCRTLLNVGENGLYGFMDQENRIPCVRTKYGFRFPRSAVLNWFAAQSRTPTQRLD